MKYLLITMIFVLNLSYPPAKASNGRYDLVFTQAKLDAGRLSPSDSSITSIFGVTPIGTVGENPFDAGTSAVPYYTLWNSSMWQTAQQRVALLSVLQGYETRLGAADQEILKARRLLEECQALRNKPLPTLDKSTELPLLLGIILAICCVLGLFSLLSDRLDSFWRWVFDTFSKRS